MTEDYTYHGPALTGRHPHIGPMPADATVLQPAEMAALHARLAAVEAALVEAEAERARLVARAEAAEAQLAAVPRNAMRSTMMFCGAELADISFRKDSRAIWNWLDAQPEVQP